MMGETFRLRLQDGHDQEHRECERLDGAVPFVVCRLCGEAWGYHVGHEGDWRTCNRGLCEDIVSTWASQTLTGTPDEQVGECSLCGEALYEDEEYGPYLNAGSGTYCYTCAGTATRGVI